MTTKELRRLPIRHDGYIDINGRVMDPHYRKRRQAWLKGAIESGMHYAAVTIDRHWAIDKPLLEDAHTLRECYLIGKASFRGYHRGYGASEEAQTGTSQVHRTR